MKVFLSWSGDRSKIAALALKKHLRLMIQALDPWISTDIGKGRRWSPEVAEALEQSGAGIVVLTPENLKEPWVNFEAGALAKMREAHVCTLLIGLQNTDVPQPLGQFQHTQFERDDFRKLIEALNAKMAQLGAQQVEPTILQQSIDTFWPGLKAEVDKIPIPETPKKEPTDTERMFSEILDQLRAMDRRARAQESRPAPESPQPSLDLIRTASEALSATRVNSTDVAQEIHDLLINSQADFRIHEAPGSIKVAYRNEIPSTMRILIQAIAMSRGVTVSFESAGTFKPDVRGL